MKPVLLLFTNFLIQIEIFYVFIIIKYDFKTILL